MLDFLVAENVYMDHKRIKHLVRTIQSDAPGAPQAMAELRRTLEGQARHYYSQNRWKFGELGPSDFADLYESAIGEAVWRYDPSRAEFTTWLVRQLVYRCREEDRSRRRLVLVDFMTLDGIAMEIKGKKPETVVWEKEELEVLKQATDRESSRSRRLVRAWTENYPPLDECAQALRITQGNAYKIRKRNIQRIADRVRRRLDPKAPRE